MKITLKTPSPYATAERVVHPNQTADLPRDEARRLIANGDAVKASDDPTRERQRPDPEPEPVSTADDDITETEQPTEDDGLRAELEQLHRHDLQARAKDADVNAGGTNDEIIDRIVTATDAAWTDDA